MKEISATEAARAFARVLDEAEAGEEFLITRKGVCVARLLPAPRANGTALNRLSRQWAGKIGLDEEFVAAVDSLDEYARGDQDRDPWQS
ncbi:type II toxin-antitoxin system Phd/YefM family antitoxin [Nocardia caishijiensis]|uniref:Antitoxin n=1 Tax=Nocardia caishijiensis TaxID=184756 RepID=A0ABQ6YTU8_9NOCA|nr:type II toxin-antitoxin system prevent-host-death family antitoxin [Nocardia caishijiensis]KAF0849232.1 prevent-host-death family protein [Nocardia caishijiensis]